MKLSIAAAVAAVSTAQAWQKGIVFGGDEWSYPLHGYNTTAAVTSLTNLAETGADHVRIIWTWYQDFENSTSIYPIGAPSALASTSLQQLEFIITTAAGLCLNVTLCPILDPSWDIASNGRSSDGVNPVGGVPVSRLNIGVNFTADDWTTWMASYTAYVMPFAQLAGKHYPSVAMFEVASELDIAFLAIPQSWRTLVSSIRSVYPGKLTIAANYGNALQITWWDALDYVGLDMYQGLGSIIPVLGVAPTVADLFTAWQPILAQAQALHTSTGLPIILTEVGYQSRPSCHARPWGTKDRDPQDDSAWIQNHDPACQANCYEALLQAWTPQPWFAGVYWWLWRTDPSHGGPGDSDFTPHGKPAEVVLRRWYGNYTCPAAGGYARLMEEGGGQWSMTGPAHASLVQAYNKYGEDSACDGSKAVQTAVQAATAQAVASSLHTQAKLTKKTWNGFVFGGPDEWSSPYYRYDSDGSKASLDAALSLGSDSIEIIAQWYFSNVTSPEVYPILDPANPLRTSTDDELTSILTYAKGKGAKTLLTLMLDPDWTLPAQAYCRGAVDARTCYWRGQYGMYADPTQCGPTDFWGQFFAGYTPALVHYAKLAEATGTDAFLLSHELQTAVAACPDLWVDALTKVRAVYSGLLTHAFQPNLLDPANVAQLPWITQLDFIGIDCYMQYLQAPHPLLPWQDTPQATVTAAFAHYLPQYANLSASTGKKIVCTEVGWSSRPWTYTGTAGMPKLDPEDCSVWDQCVSGQAHAIAYTAFFETYYQQPWFDGVLWWTWRADPTVGGTSDDGFSPAGKPSAAAIASYWTA